MPGKYISFETACRHAAGKDAAGGAVLSRVLYWQPKAKIKRGGRYWIADIRKAWAYDCGLTVKSFDLAVKRLLQKGMIEKRQGPHPSGCALNCLYLRAADGVYKKVMVIKNAGVPTDSLLQVPW